MMRRMRDIVAASLGLLLLLPLLVGVSLAVVIADGRPVLFLQVRSGLRRRPFRLAKFRTMTDRRDALGQLLPDALRITATGRILRATRIDELPQLWNVLIGDMSLVGPRPLLPATIRLAGSRGWMRSTVRPGLTGWAQVNGNALLDDGDKFALDEWYVAHRAHRLDLQIIARTLLVVLQGERVDPVAVRRAHARSPHRRR